MILAVAAIGERTSTADGVAVLHVEAATGTVEWSDMPKEESEWSMYQKQEMDEKNGSRTLYIVVT